MKRAFYIICVFMLVLQTNRAASHGLSTPWVLIDPSTCINGSCPKCLTNEEYGIYVSLEDMVKWKQQVNVLETIPRIFSPVLEINNWPGNEVHVSIARILLEEVLQFKVHMVAREDYLDVYSRVANGSITMNLETWDDQMSHQKQYYVNTLGQVDNGGSLGTVGREHLYIPDYSFANPEFSKHIVEHYRGLYNIDAIRALPQDGTTPCELYTVSKNPNCPTSVFECKTETVRPNGTALGCTNEDFDYVCSRFTPSWRLGTKCQHGRYYPPHCLPLEYTSSGIKSPYCAEITYVNTDWTPGWFEAVATNLGLNFSFVYLGWDNFNIEFDRRVAEELPIVYFWYEPDGRQVKTPSQEIHFPRHTAECEASDKQDPSSVGVNCQIKAQSLGKIIWSQVRTRSNDYSRQDRNDYKDLHNFFTSYRMSESDHRLFLSWIPAGGGSMNSDEAACRWVKTHFHVWRNWIQLTENLCEEKHWGVLIGECGENPRDLQAQLHVAPDSRLVTFYWKQPKRCVKGLDKPPPQIISCPYSSIQSSAVLSLVVVVCVFLLLNLIFCFGVLYHWKSSVIKRSVPEFLIIMLVGAIIAYCWILISLQVTSDFGCVLRAYLLSFAIDLILASLLVKTWRINRIFNNKDMAIIVINNRQLLFQLFRLISIDIIIFIVWFFTDPPHLAPIKPKIPTVSISSPIWNTIDPDFVCVSTHNSMNVVSIAYKFMLMLYGCYISYRVRNITLQGVHEAKWIVLVIYNTTVMYFFAILFYVFSRDGGVPLTTTFIVDSCIVAYCVTFATCAIMLPKLKLVGIKMSQKHPSDVRDTAENRNGGSHTNMNPENNFENAIPVASQSHTEKGWCSKSSNTLNNSSTKSKVLSLPSTNQSNYAGLECRSFRRPSSKKDEDKIIEESEMHIMSAVQEHSCKESISSIKPRAVASAVNPPNLSKSKSFFQNFYRITSAPISPITNERNLPEKKNATRFNSIIIDIGKNSRSPERAQELKTRIQECESKLVQLKYELSLMEKRANYPK